jgi:hypothetical protein
MFKGTRQNGRTVGSVNRTTKEIRETFKNLLENNLEQVQNDLDSLDPKDRVLFLLKLTSFVIPTLRSIEVNEMNIKDIEPIIIQINNETNSD